MREASEAGKEHMETGGEGTEGEKADTVRQRVGREAMTYGMRVGEIGGIIHGARWKQYTAKNGQSNRYDEGGKHGCPMGCGAKCTIPCTLHEI